MTGKTELWPIALLTLLSACASEPTEEEVRVLRDAKCAELREQITAAAGRPLLRTRLQEEYDYECLGISRDSGRQ